MFKNIKEINKITKFIYNSISKNKIQIIDNNNIDLKFIFPQKKESNILKIDKEKIKEYKLIKSIDTDLS